MGKTTSTVQIALVRRGNAVEFAGGRFKLDRAEYAVSPPRNPRKEIKESGFAVKEKNKQFEVSAGCD